MSGRGSRRGRSRATGHPVDEHVDERWLVSYADMITVLMCLFIVLFAMSTVDQQKFQDLRESLATGFGAEASETADSASGVLVPPEVASGESDTLTPAGNITDWERAKLEVNELTALREQIRNGLVQQGLERTVGFAIDERGLTIRLVGSETFFQSNSTTLSDVARRVLASIGQILAGSSNELSIEGHADTRQSAFPFATNWELSSGRATEVLRHLVESSGVAGERIGAVGYGSARPIAAGAAPTDLASNRRVDIVVLSDEPEAVRALIAEVIEAGS
ncbi:MAG: hypothetical protein JWL94_913 [Microbacteriaceae bacterium]|jgi:chemotaxis protein MotB|nr:hypothetical protein [Microbacteriaceae bacterium]HEV7956135.1 flagellar motor protein MotB [Marisediminicola sp.]